MQSFCRSNCTVSVNTAGTKIKKNRIIIQIIKKIGNLEKCFEIWAHAKQHKSRKIVMFFFFLFKKKKKKKKKKKPLKRAYDNMIATLIRKGMPRCRDLYLSELMETVKVENVLKIRRVKKSA